VALLAAAEVTNTARPASDFLSSGSMQRINWKLAVTLIAITSFHGFKSICPSGEDGSVVGAFGRSGRNAGQFHWIHAMAVDAKGNVYTAEVDNGKRIQKFKLTSDALR